METWWDVKSRSVFSGNLCFCLLVLTCVCSVPEGSPLLVRHRRSGILPESAAGGEDGAVGQVVFSISSVSQTSLGH